jgi:uncharacterized surface protein with fasciclin (FAS1) repeats
MIKEKLFLSAFVLLIVIFSCKKDDYNKYDRPEWLTGKVYTQIKSEEDLSTFALCLELTGYDKVVDVSGSYTVFAPTNEAFQLYFQSHPAYKSVEDIPADKLLSIVKYHIVQNPWSRNQLRSLDVNGWIDPDDEFNNKPRGFKRETLLLGKDVKFGVEISSYDDEELIIIDTARTTWNRRVATDSRKFAPIFFPNTLGYIIFNFRTLAFISTDSSIAHRICFLQMQS